MRETMLLRLGLIVVSAGLVAVLVYYFWIMPPCAVKYELATPEGATKPQIYHTVERGQRIQFRDNTGNGFGVHYTPLDLFIDQTSPITVPPDGTVIGTVKDDYEEGTLVTFKAVEPKHGGGELIIEGGP